MISALRKQQSAHSWVTRHRHRSLHTVDTLLVMAADTVAGIIKGLLEGKMFRRTSYAPDRASCEATLGRLFEQSVTPANSGMNGRMAALVRTGGSLPYHITSALLCCS
jgi:hypothetical protein